MRFVTAILQMTKQLEEGHRDDPHSLADRHDYQTYKADGSTNTKYLYPKDPAGLRIYIKYDTLRPLKPEDIYAAAIDVIYDWADDGWDTDVPKDTGKFTKDFAGVSVGFRSIATEDPPPEGRIRYKYLILGVLHLIKEMSDNKRWVASFAIVELNRTPLGFVDFNPVGDPFRVGSNNETNVTNTVPATTSATRDLSATKRLFDPDDHDVSVSYEVKGPSFPCVEILSTALYAMATAAQAPGDQTCQVFGGLNPSRKLQWSTFVKRPSYSGYILTYGIIRKAWRLFPQQMYKSKKCGEVSFTYEYKGDDLGGGSIWDSNLAPSPNVGTAR
ncbi:hypothetical protein ACLMJK_002179 [Lecanora helva]